MGENPRQPVLIGNSEEMLIMNSDDPSLFKISILAINYNFSTLKKKSLFLFHTITYRCYFGFKQGLLSISTYLIDVQWLSPIPLFGTPWTVASQAPLSMGFPRQEILEWVTISFFRGAFQVRNSTHTSCIGMRVLYPLSHQGSPCINSTMAKIQG